MAISGTSVTHGGDTTHLASDSERLFATSVLPLLQAKCFACHGSDPDDIKGELDLTQRSGLLRGGESGEPAVVPGKPEQSLLWQAVRWDGLEMPPKKNDRLTEEQIELVGRWIAGGAHWPAAGRREVLRQEEWQSTEAEGVTVSTSGGLTDDWTNRRYKPADLWAYQPVKRPHIPWSHARGSENPIDCFVNRRLSESGLEPLPSADRRTLIRRLSYDLTGLPPTPTEIDEFLADTPEHAYDTLLERLLASPHYGQHWATHWLDVVRYADSSGFSNDFIRPNAWRYRDYVIRSFNTDKPYDQFVREQIAGDEIDPDNPDCLIAVGYLRMGPWEHTGMSVAAVTRQQFLDDVTNSVGVTFLGQELRCAKCHDHKFDPIPTRDYYRMQAIFAPVQFVDRTVPYQPHENVDGFARREARIRRLQDAGGVKSLTTLSKEQWPVDEFDTDTEIKGHKKVNAKRSQYLQRELKRFKPLAFSVYSGPDRGFTSTKVVSAMPATGKRQGEASPTHILKGGALETPGELVQAGVLSVIQADEWSSFLPDSTFRRRAALAEWLTDEDHPLTARVMVNRVWHYHFGRGLAGNPNNFGATGQRPTHPELLDYLADYFVQHDWSLKQLHRLILTSRTWRRASQPVSTNARKIDPDNRLYSHFTPRRLSAEELRDSMLLVSGELNTRPGGLPTRPEINMEVAMQPRHIMGSVAPAYQPSRTPEQRNRRTIYTERIRTLRDPMLEVFNQPGLDTSCERRDSSTITPQAFTLLNSQNSFDRALALAERLRGAAPLSPDEQIELAFRLVFGRQASEKETTRCRAHFDEMLSLHRRQTPVRVDPPKYVVREMVEEMTGLNFYWVEDLDVYQDYVSDRRPWDASAEVRAMADVCLVLLNSNEFIYVY